MTAVPVADCSVVDRVQPDQVVYNLSQYRSEQSPASQFAQTVEYARHPREYLINTIGEEAVNARGDLLCIPEKVDSDFYGTGSTKSDFELHVARLLGKQHGLFFQTGVQAQLTAMKIHCQRAKNDLVAWHITCHLESAEENSYKELYGLRRILLGESPDVLPTVDEIKLAVSQREGERPAAIVVEIPNRSLGCETYSFEQLQDISAACKAAGVTFHIDGARLWEIEPYYQSTAGKTFADIGALCDSLYVSFYKGLVGYTGAMLASNDATLINEAKVWQRRAGGNPFSISYEVLDDQRGFNENIGTFARKRDKMVRIAKQIIEKSSSYRTWNGEPMVSFRPYPPTCCQIHTLFRGFTEAELNEARDKVERYSKIRLYNKLRPKKTVDELLGEGRLTADAKATKQNGTNVQSVSQNGTAVDADANSQLHFMEWTIIPATEEYPDHIFVDGYVRLCEELLAARKS